MEITLEDIKHNNEITCFIKRADYHLNKIGYTEHGERHAHIVSKLAKTLLVDLRYERKECELAGISGYLHDIGNFMGRDAHGISGAVIVLEILRTIKMPIKDIAVVMGAIANHEEERGDPSDVVSAAVILADKADVHRSRVRKTGSIATDIHDRVNYAAERSTLNANYEEKNICLDITIDTSISQVMEYFEIFLSRMIICRRAAVILGCKFELLINGTKLW